MIIIIKLSVQYWYYGDKKSDTGKVWGDVLNTWQQYSEQKVIGEGLDCGHYLQEEQPEKVLTWLNKFL